MSCPRFDFHIHTKYLRCANETMEVEAVVRQCEQLGLSAIAFTDHLNRFEQEELHKPIIEDIRRLDTDLDVYFGVELNFMECDGEFPFNEEIKARSGFQFAIGGIHDTYLQDYDLGRIVDIQHRHHLAVCRNPLVDVLVHPYWFSRGEFADKGFPPFDSMKAVPEAYARELGQAARDTNTAIEINAEANLHSMGERFAAEYPDYLAIVAEQGCMFSLGSDAHDISKLADITDAWMLAEKLGLTENRIWRPGGRPMC